MVEILIILCLILINAVLAGTEIAVLSARRPLLVSQAQAGDRGAEQVLHLLDYPGTFLSTIQVGITLVGILAGALGGADAVRYMAPRLAQLPVRGAATYAEPVAFGLVVLAITYLTLVVGELVPKRLALRSPVPISKAMATPIRCLALVARPVVWLLSTSTDLLLRLLRVSDTQQPSVTEDEVRYLVAEGARSGVFVPAEKELVDRIFRFADQRVVEVMRPRRDIVAFEIEEPAESVRDKLRASGFSRFPVCRGDLSNILGVVHAKDILTQEGPLALQPLVREVLFVPETNSLIAMLEAFQATHSHLAIVMNEFGGTEGLVTLEDVLEEIVGEIRDEYDHEERAVVRRKDGSLLIDGSLSLADLKDVLDVQHLDGEETRDFHTLAGFIMGQLRRVPQEGDTVESSGYRFEVVDMDGLRVDKVLVHATVSA